MGELTAAVLRKDEPIFDPFTGAELAHTRELRHSPSMRAGLEAPRFCQICGRRMVVRIQPMGWVATCARHGDLSSELLER